MEQLIFVGIVVLFSILEAVARKGRAAQGKGEGAPVPEAPKPRRPRPRPRQESEPVAGSVPHSYDEDPSFDEAAKGDEARARPEPVQDRAPPIGEGSAPPRTSSEGLIPAEVWDEIQGLARGELPEARTPPAPTLPAPERPRPTMSRPAGWPKPSPRPRTSREAGASRRAGAPTAQPRTGRALGRTPSVPSEEAPAQEGTAGHPVHLAHEAFGTAPSQRAGGPPQGGAPAAQSPAGAIRKLLAGDRAPLRQAVILQEILGPPPGLRDG